MQVFADTRKSAADCSWLTAACWRRAGVGVTQQSARMPPRDLPPLVSSPSCRSARSGSAESIHVDSAADRYGLNRPKDLIGRSDGRVQRKLRMIGTICRNVAAERFRVRPASAWASCRVTGHEFAMACVQTPLCHEVRSRSRGHLLSKSDLQTPCVVDIAIRSVPKCCYPDLAEESRKPP